MQGTRSVLQDPGFPSMVNVPTLGPTVCRCDVLCAVYHLGRQGERPEMIRQPSAMYTYWVTAKVL